MQASPSQTYDLNPIQLRLYIEKVTCNKTILRHNCHVMWRFSAKRPSSQRLRNAITFPCSSTVHVYPHLMFSTSYFKSSLYTISVLGQNPPGQNPPGQNPLDKIPLDKIPPRTKSPRTKSPWTKSPHYIPPNCSIAQYFLLYINVIFESQFSSTFVRCDIFHGDEVEKRS